MHCRTGSNGTIIVQRVDGITGNLSYTGTGSTSDRNWQIVANTGNLLFQNSATGILTLQLWSWPKQREKTARSDLVHRWRILDRRTRINNQRTT
ncbi:hypothetical protein [Mesorhizobium sp. 43Arga]